jgi:MFS family permease
VSLTAEGGPTPSVLRHPPFARFWCSRVLSIVAFQIQAVAVGWQVYAISGRALDLGLVGLAQFVPMILLTLLVGHTADRYDRRAISSLCQTAEGLATATLALGTLAGWLDVPRVLAIVAVIGAARAFEGPTMSALMPSLVPRALIPQASAWYASATQTAQIVGPAVGGVLFGLAPSAPYVTAALLFLAAAVLLGRGGRAAKAPRASNALESFFSGLLFIRRERILLGVLSLDLFAVLVGGVTALLPIYARDILATGPWGLGLLRAAPAAGALAMSVVLARRPVSRRVGRTMFGSVVVFGVAILVFGASRSLPLSLAALAVLGAADVVSVVIRYSLVQLSTPDDMRGRVSAAFSLFTGTSNQLGEFRAGVTAAVLGVVPAVLLGGVGTVAVALVWMVAFPELRRIRGLP